MSATQAQGAACNLLSNWEEDGWLLVTDPTKRKRAYGLSAFRKAQNKVQDPAKLRRLISLIDE